MNYPFAIISVFTDEENNFKGNTAAIVELDKAISEEKMQEIASDFNQPATTFIWRVNDQYNVRWFAPDAEIDLCGHGSLAAFAFLHRNEITELHFRTGVIRGKKDSAGTYSMFLEPIFSTEAGSPDQPILEGIDKNIVEYHSNNNKNILVLENEEAVRTLNPDFGKLKKMEPFGIIATAKGEDVDFVSRTLVPKVQQLEDHATGSSHAALTPFWSDRLKKQKMTAYQLSPRGGKFICKLENNKVVLSGKAKLIASGHIHD